MEYSPELDQAAKGTLKGFMVVSRGKNIALKDWSEIRNSGGR